MVTGIWLGGNDDKPLLVLGPSLGTSARTLWQECAEHLGEHVRVLGWDLPGHGENPDPGVPGLTMAQLAADVVAMVDDLAGSGTPFHYAGDSVGGAVGLQLLLDAPERVPTATLLCTGAKIGTEQGWAERRETVLAEGTASMVDGSAQRWFAPGFIDREPQRAQALLSALAASDAAGYGAVCDALGAFDVRSRLAEIGAPVLAVAGQDDAPTPPSSLAEIADGVQRGRLVVLPAVAHLAPAEEPQRVAELILEHINSA